MAPTPRPYRESRIGRGTLLREFAGDTPTDDLIWHQDRRDRTIRVIQSRGWQLQLSEGLPFPLIEGNSYSIPARSWHRVIRGDGSLKIEIQEREKMKITESQLRKIVREEILREGVGSTYMSTASGPDYGKYVDTLGAEKAADIYHGATSKAGMGASPDARNRMAIAELEKAYQDALAAGAPEADGGFMAWLKGLLGKR